MWNIAQKGSIDHGSGTSCEMVFTINANGFANVFTFISVTLSSKIFTIRCIMLSNRHKYWGEWRTKINLVKPLSMLVRRGQRKKIQMKYVYFFLAWDRASQNWPDHPKSSIILLDLKWPVYKNQNQIPEIFTCTQESKLTLPAISYPNGHP